MRPKGSAAQLEYRRQLGGRLSTQGKGVCEVALARRHTVRRLALEAGFGARRQVCVVGQAPSGRRAAPLLGAESAFGAGVGERPTGRGVPHRAVGTAFRASIREAA
jgi:hypothetical protein